MQKIIYKFGGVSVKSADAIKNVGNIIKSSQTKPVVIVSAMGKMTNKFEKLVDSYISEDNESFNKILEEIKTYHKNIIAELFNNSNIFYEQTNSIINKTFDNLQNTINNLNTNDYNFIYDQIVSFGEIISSKILHKYLNHIGIETKWIDIRENIITDKSYRNASILWEETQKNVCSNFNINKTIVTQGFIASDGKFTTTLGREGSDFSASILAYSLDAEKIIIWKDVEGIMNADPRIFNDAKKIDSLNYKETVELAYYGAQVIHPKTIKPLQNKNIPLFVKSFVNPTSSGTIIDNRKNIDIPNTITIIKNNQVLISVMAKDFSFINEHNISIIFSILAKIGIKVNMMENSAVSFSLVIDDSNNFNSLIRYLSEYFEVKYNKNLTLFTFRHYQQKELDNLLKNRTIFLEQKTRNIARFLVSYTKPLSRW